MTLGSDSCAESVAVWAVAPDADPSVMARPVARAASLIVDDNIHEPSDPVRSIAADHAPDALSRNRNAHAFLSCAACPGMAGSANQACFACSLPRRRKADYSLNQNRAPHGAGQTLVGGCEIPCLDDTTSSHGRREIQSAIDLSPTVSATNLLRESCQEPARLCALRTASMHSTSRPSASSSSARDRATDASACLLPAEPLDAVGRPSVCRRTSSGEVALPRASWLMIAAGGC